jgi:hypothetical protein
VAARPHLPREEAESPRRVAAHRVVTSSRDTNPATETS